MLLVEFFLSTFHKLESCCYHQVRGDKCVTNILALRHLIDMNLFDTGLEVAEIARCGN